MYTDFEKKVVVSMVKQFGLTGTKEALQRLAGISIVTLCNWSKESGVSLRRGRPSVAKPTVAKPKQASTGNRFSDDEKQEMLESIEERGLTGTQRHFEKKGRYVSLPTLWKWAKEEGIELQRGRPTACN